MVRKFVEQAMTTMNRMNKECVEKTNEHGMALECFLAADMAQEKQESPDQENRIYFQI